MHDYVTLPKATELPTLNGCIVWYRNDVSVKLLKKKKESHIFGPFHNSLMENLF